MLRRAKLLLAVASLPLAMLARIGTPSAKADENELVGTWKLVSSTRKFLDTGESVVLRQQGCMMYGADGRMMALVLVAGRPKPESLDKLTDQQRAELFRTMVAYAGRYTFDGKTVEHVVDSSWNEVWTGTKQIRDVTRDGDRLIFTTRPAPSSGDGRMSMTTIIWEKSK